MAGMRRLIPDDLQRLRQFWVEHWGGEVMISRGNTYRPDDVDGGFVVEDGDEWIGLVTFMIRDDECEVTSLDSLREGQSIGAKLIDAVVDEARKKNCKRLFLITTNDNLRALGFYQRRNFVLVKLYPNAMEKTRKIKPSVPLIGYNDIPLRDEIELEINL
jgi:ribosomal protein S18 acetylase RimI-like enzyme